jgi:hypothetical protein
MINPIYRPSFELDEDLFKKAFKNETKRIIFLPEELFDLIPEDYWSRGDPIIKEGQIIRYAISEEKRRGLLDSFFEELSYIIGDKFYENQEFVFVSIEQAMRIAYMRCKYEEISLSHLSGFHGEMMELAFPERRGGKNDSYINELFDNSREALRNRRVGDYRPDYYISSKGFLITKYQKDSRRELGTCLCSPVQEKNIFFDKMQNAILYGTEENEYKPPIREAIYQKYGGERSLMRFQCKHIQPVLVKAFPREYRYYTKLFLEIVTSNMLSSIKENGLSAFEKAKIEFRLYLNTTGFLNFLLCFGQIPSDAINITISRKVDSDILDFSGEKLSWSDIRRGNGGKTVYKFSDEEFNSKVKHQAKKHLKELKQKYFYIARKAKDNELPIAWESWKEFVLDIQDTIPADFERYSLTWDNYRKDGFCLKSIEWITKEERKKRREGYFLRGRKKLFKKREMKEKVEKYLNVGDEFDTEEDLFDKL